MKKIFSLVVMAITICFSTTIVNAESTADSLIKNSKKYIGTPYVFGAKSPSAGFDCSGFAQYVFEEKGIQLPRTTSQQFKAGKAINKKDLIKGDLVFFQTYRTGPSHLGIYIENNKFIHASTSKGITISSLNESYWNSRYIGARRVLTSQQIIDVEKIFNDVSSQYWAFDEIKDLKEDGIVSGDGNGFNPEDPITYEQVKTMITRSLGEKEFPSDIELEEKDSTDQLTREEVSAIINTAYELESNSNNENDVEFNDINESDKYYSDVQKAISSGYIGGYSDNTFRPHKLITRAEFAVILSRVKNI
ncbi:C40 family peptidase [Bacillus sp. Marseille-P3661]|uniref:C40 family peptidase n=1 Tax=Bacillus sp. Marseille-P3661 TaxID=1936234 RepID=UPI000C83D0B1|nr:C40 family peptidase [Bacillus sp. Marseille-P3661]